MHKERLKLLISLAINQSDIKIKNDEILIWCPICNKSRSNKKISLNINHNSKTFGKWHCWVCENTNNAKGNTIQSLFKFFNSTENYYIQLKILLEELNITQDFKTEENIEEEKVIFPTNEIIPINKPNSKYLFEITNAVNYLNNRGIDKTLINVYNMHVGVLGDYQNRVIIPSYDNNYKVNYFTARSMYNTKLKYLNPNVSKNKIIFENILNFNYPILLVEGMFDAITARRNSTALMGKTVNDKLFQKINNNSTPVIVCLDKDAKNNAIKIIETFLEHNIETYYIQMDKKDPNEIGFEKFIKNYYNNKVKVNFDTLIKIRLNFL